VNWRIVLWSLIALLILAVAQLQREINALESSIGSRSDSSAAAAVAKFEKDFFAHQAELERIRKEEAMAAANAMSQDARRSMDQLNALAPDYSQPMPRWPEDKK
jgi:hypothetical protein